MAEAQLKPLVWIGSSRDAYTELSSELQDEFGFGLYQAQLGNHPPGAKMLKGFGGAVVELIGNDAGGTYRTVYTAHFAGVIYVLHVFQKKSKQGVKTPKHEVNLIRSRLSKAAAHYQEHKHAIKKNLDQA